MQTENITSKCPKCQGQMYGRHCLDCGFSRGVALSEEAMERKHRTAKTSGVAEEREVEDVRRLNREALWELTKAFPAINLVGTLREWRPTAREAGEIAGLGKVFYVLCTDGIAAWFQDSEGNLLHGHVGHFSGEVRPLYSVEKQAEPKGTKGKAPRAKKISSVQKAMDALNAAIEGM